MELGTMVRCTPGLEGDVSETEEREVDMGDVNSNFEQVAVGGVGQPNVSLANNWNPFVDPCAGPDLGLGDSQPDKDPGLAGHEVFGARVLEGGFIRDQVSEGGGAQLELSNLSVSSHEIRSDRAMSNIHKVHKKAQAKHSKPPLPLIGAPLSMKIALSERPAGRRKKGEVSKKGSSKGQ
jgi:hypothetical protein